MRASPHGVPPGVPRRVLDLLITGTAFLLLLPLFVLLALLVLMSSPGPVIFRQQRVGQGGNPFTLHKYRTMRNGSSGPNVTTGDNSSLTPIGKLLRHVCHDEVTPVIYTLSRHMAVA